MRQLLTPGRLDTADHADLLAVMHQEITSEDNEAALVERVSFLGLRWLLKGWCDCLLYFPLLTGSGTA
jgi:hypothetical protein